MTAPRARPRSILVPAYFQTCIEKSTNEAIV